MSAGCRCVPLISGSAICHTARDEDRLAQARARSVLAGAHARASAAEPDRQRLELVYEGRFDVHRLARELDLREAPQRLLEEDAQLQARERGAQAEVAPARAE